MINELAPLLIVIVLLTLSWWLWGRLHATRKITQIAARRAGLWSSLTELFRDFAQYGWLARYYGAICTIARFLRDGHPDALQLLVLLIGIPALAFFANFATNSAPTTPWLANFLPSGILVTLALLRLAPLTVLLASAGLMAIVAEATDPLLPGVGCYVVPDLRVCPVNS
jgi:hypothetical protein